MSDHDDAVRAKRRAAERARIEADPEKYRLRNRDKMRKRREIDRDKVNAAKRRYAANRRLRDPEGYAALVARKSIKLREKRLANHEAARAKEKAALARRMEKNPDLKRIEVQKRVALKRGAPGAGVTTADWTTAKSLTAGMCVYCAQISRLTMDHIEPLSKGGAHDPSNIVAACDRCNKSKGNKPVLEWMARMAA